MPMMGFHNFNIDAVAQCFGSRLHQFKSQIHTRRKIGRLADCERLGGRTQPFTLVVSEAGCADHHGHTMLGTHLCMGQSRLG